MSLKSLIDNIVPQIPNGYNRTGSSRSILQLIDDGQRELTDYDGLGQRYIGTDNDGYPPFLTTVAGTVKYTIEADNLTDITTITRTLGGAEREVRCRRVLGVFIDSATAFDYGMRWIGQEEPFSYLNPYTTATTRIMVRKVHVTSFPAFAEDPAYIIFPEDPGSTTETFFVDFVWEPAPLTAEGNPLSVPQRFERALEDYVIGTVQERSGGKPSERLGRFYAFWVPQYHMAMDAQPQIRPRTTIPRVC